MTKQGRQNHWVERSTTDEDLDRYLSLVTAVNGTLAGQELPQRENVAGWFVDGPIQHGRDARIVVDDGDGAIGWVYVRDPGEPYAVVPVGALVHPMHSYDEVLWDRLIAFAQDRGKEVAGEARAGARVVARTHIPEDDGHRIAAFERAGFAAVRASFDMRVLLDKPPVQPVLPAGVEVRAFRYDQNLEELIVATNEAFRDHWGTVQQPMEQLIGEWRHWIEVEMNEQFDPSLWPLAVVDGKIVGFMSAGRVAPKNDTEAQLFELGVLREWRGRGIGRALLLTVFGLLHERGFASARGHVDSENLTGALRLYESVGMVPFRTTLTLEKELRAGEDPVVRELS